MSDELDNEYRLVEELRKLCERGPIPAVSNGSNAIGKTMQSNLNIPHSTTRRNDFLGFTLTSTTSAHSSGSRTNLFSSVACWESSEIKSSTELLEKFGRVDDTGKYDRSMFCTLDANNPNSFGLMLSVDTTKKIVEEHFRNNSTHQCILKWDVNILAGKLSRLDKTAIITADPVNLPSGKAFHYRYLEILKNPSLDRFLELLHDGVITLDHCISLEKGKSKAREQGPLFKIRADSRSLLFETSKKIDLLDFS